MMAAGDFLFGVAAVVVSWLILVVITRDGRPGRRGGGR